MPNPDIEAHLRSDDLMPAVPDPTRRYITSYDPATTYHLGTFVADNGVEISEKIERAAAAQQGLPAGQVENSERSVDRRFYNKAYTMLMARQASGRPYTERDAVADMRLPEALDLGGVLDRFHGFDWGWDCEDSSCRN